MLAEQEWYRVIRHTSSESAPKVIIFPYIEIVTVNTTKRIDSETEQERALDDSALGFWSDIRLALLVALIWVGHIGANRLVGYGLKFESGFKDTHLSTQPAPIRGFAQSDE